jgi:hypothetical protein
MDPNVKLMFEEFVKQVCDEIRDSFVAHESIVNNHLSEFMLVDQWCGERVVSFESAASGV